MVVQLLQQYFVSLAQQPAPQQRDPQFQGPFKKWVIEQCTEPQLAALASWVQSVDDTWPSAANVNALGNCVCQTFEARDWPTAFGHLLLTLTPAYHPTGAPWLEDEDPIRLPPINVGRFYRCLEAYLAARQPQCDATRAVLQKGPPAKGVILVRDGTSTRGKMHQARAVRIPYTHFLSSYAAPPLQPVDFNPDLGCRDSMHTAARECVAQLKEARWFDRLLTVLGRSLDCHVAEVVADCRRVKMALRRRFGRATPPLSLATWQRPGAFLEQYLRFASLGLMWLGVVFYASVVLAGVGWSYSVNPLLLFLPHPQLWWGLGVACVCLLGGLGALLLWSGRRGRLPRPPNLPSPATRGHYFLVFVEELDETPYEQSLEGISFGLAFCCALVGAVAPGMQRPPAWARYLMELMQAGEMVACAGLTNSTGDHLQPVDVRAKLAAIGADPSVTTGIFALRNCGEILAQWAVKRARVQGKWLQARVRARGLRVCCCDTVEQLLSYGLIPYQWYRIVARLGLVVLCLLGLVTLWSPSPTVAVHVYAGGVLKPRIILPELTQLIIPDMQPDDQVTIQLTLAPRWWPLAVQVASEAKTLSAGAASHCVIHKWVWPQTPANVAFRMPPGASQVLVGVTVQDWLHRRAHRTLVFALGPRAAP